MADSREHCFFHELYGCQNKKENLQNGYKARIKTVINCSNQLNDTYHVQLESLLESEPVNPRIRVHKSCVSRYTSSTNVQAHIVHVRKMERVDDDNEQMATKRMRSSVGDQFDFKIHCLFCPTVSVCTLASEYDMKKPKERRKRSFQIRSHVKAGGQEYKQYILDICQKRNDDLGETVMERVLGAVGDLHAADARCHESCRASFISAHNIEHFSSASSTPTEDMAFKSVCNKMLEDRRKTWSSVELFALYVEEGGSCMCRKTLFKQLTEYHGENVLVMSSPSFANVIGFSSELTKSLPLVKSADDDLQYCVDRVASAITTESIDLRKKRDLYHINIDKELARESVSDTTALLLSKISSKFDNDSLAMILIGNIITSVTCSQSTDLQVALGILMRRNKMLISELAKYSICCSYDEVRLFRYSAAVHVAHNYDEVGFGMSGSDSLRHCICDNFDAEISSPNCKICVHCLAMIMTNVQLPGNASSDEVASKRKPIKRQPMQDRSKPVAYVVEQEKYDGPK